MRYAIDISYANSDDDIDWEALKEQGVERCIVRIGYRGRHGIYLDDSFIENINTAKEHGLDVGIYFYTSAMTVDEAKEDAEQVLAWCNEYLQTCNLTNIWYDVEDAATIGTLMAQEITDICSAFICTMNAAGYSAGVYSSYNWFAMAHKILYENLAPYVPLFVAQYNSECDFHDERLSLWQFTDKFLGYHLDASVIMK